MNANSCPECKRRAKKDVPMVLVECETCREMVCGACWCDHYEKHTGKSPNHSRGGGFLDDETEEDYGNADLSTPCEAGRIVEREVLTSLRGEGIRSWTDERPNTLDSILHGLSRQQLRVAGGPGTTSKNRGHISPQEERE